MPRSCRVSFTDGAGVTHSVHIAAESLYEALNSRQVAVLRLVFEGLLSGEIAARLDVTPIAVKNTLQQLFSKTGVKNRSQMVRAALERYGDLL